MTDSGDPDKYDGLGFNDGRWGETDHDKDRENSLPTVRPQCRRVFNRATRTPPRSIDTGGVRIDVFIRPGDDSAQTFFNGGCEYLRQHDNISLFVRPVAIEMSTAVVAGKSDLRACVNAVLGRERTVRSTYIAEACHAVRDISNDEAFLAAARHAAFINPETVTSQIIGEVAKVGLSSAEGRDGTVDRADIKAATEMVGQGIHRGHVRRDTTAWTSRFPGGPHAVYVGGEPVRTPDYDAVHARVEAVADLRD